MIKRLSHSSISVFDCPRRGYRMKIKKEIPFETTMPLVLGSAFHGLMELASFSCQWDEGSLLSVWPDLLGDFVSKATNWRKKPTRGDISKAIKDGEGMTQAVFKNHSRFLVPPFRKDGQLWIEKDFNINIYNFPVIGFLDLTIPDGDKVIVADWKTSKAISPPDENVSGYNDQLELYSLACRLLGVKVSELVLVFPRLGEEVCFTPSKAGYMRQQARVKRVVDMLETYKKEASSEIDDVVGEQVFPLKPYKKTCMWCEFRDTCPGKKQIEAKDQRDSVMKAKRLKELLKNG